MFLLATGDLDLAVCGILGVFAQERVNRVAFEAALDSLHLRGPDGAGVWWSEDGCVGLGHRRLAINDLFGGHQPFQEPRPDGWVVSVNGEFSFP